MPALSSCRSPSSFACSPHKGGTIHRLLFCLLPELRQSRSSPVGLREPSTLNEFSVSLGMSHMRKIRSWSNYFGSISSP
jgi:hypothetical protein